MIERKHYMIEDALDREEALDDRDEALDERKH